MHCQNCLCKRYGYLSHDIFGLAKLKPGWFRVSIKYVLLLPRMAKTTVQVTKLFPVEPIGNVGNIYRYRGFLSRSKPG